MILSMKRQIQLRALVASKGTAEAAVFCDVPEGVITLALAGEDLPVWEAHNIVDTLELLEETDAN